MIIQPSRSVTTRISISAYRFPISGPGLSSGTCSRSLLLKGFDERGEGRKIGRLECVEANHHGAISPPI